jgi:uncharacterized protein (TIGR00369 family)
MNINTHKLIDRQLCGTPVEFKNGFSQIKLLTTERMIVDDYNLVHGAFVFGLADHAAMLAVNDPNVVLSSASVKFLKPVQVDEVLTAEAHVVKVEGKKQNVHVKVLRDSESVFEGDFVCFTLTKHVLDS